MAKRLLSFIICLALLIPLAAVHGGAEGASRLYASDLELFQGGSQRIAINAEALYGVAAIDFGLYFGGAPVNVSSPVVSGLLSSSVNDVSVSEDAVSFSAIMTEAVSGDGVIAYVTLEVPSDAEPGVYYLSLSAGDVYGADLSPKSVSSSTFKLTVKEYIAPVPTQNMRTYSLVIGSSFTMGDTVSVSFRTNYITDLGAFDFETEYDDSLLDLKSVSLSSALISSPLALYSVNSDTPGYVKGTYINAEGASGYFSPMVSYTFEVIGNVTDSTLVTFSPKSVYDSSRNPIIPSGSAATVELYETVVVPDKPKISLRVTDDSYESVTVSVYADGETNLAAGDFTITYDNTRLTCTDLIVSGIGMITKNIKDNVGTVKFSFILDEGLTDDTKLCDLVFTKRNTSCGMNEIAFAGKNLANDDFDPVDADIVGASVQTHEEVDNATCVEPAFCPVCGEHHGDPLSTNGHILGDSVIENRIEPTCTQKGSYEAVAYCRICGAEILRELITIETIAHVSAEAVEENRIEPACEVKGSYESVVYCTRCGVELSRETIEIDELWHEYVLDTYEPTCTTPGYTEWTCIHCGDNFIMDYVDAIGHEVLEWTCIAEPTCTEKGEEVGYCYRCYNTVTREIPALGHNLIHHETKSPTCTEIGWGAYDTCSRCDYTTYEELEALGHDLIHHEAQAATCTEIGWEAYDTCSRCDYTTYEELEALGHKYDAVVIDPSCTEGGYTTYTCTRCGDSYIDEYTEATGHTPDSGTVTAKPTYTQTGIMTYECTVCHLTWTEEIPKLDPLPGDVNGDGRINSRDLAQMKKYIAGVVLDDGIVFVNTDINGDNRVNSKDISALKKLFVQ